MKKRPGPVQFTIQHSAFFLLTLWSTTLVAQILPPPPVRPQQTNALPSQIRLLVRGFRFEGNKAFSDSDLAKVTEPFIYRELSSEDIEQARRAVSLYYVNHGY